MSAPGKGHSDYLTYAVLNGASLARADTHTIVIVVAKNYKRSSSFSDTPGVIFLLTVLVQFSRRANDSIVYDWVPPQVTYSATFCTCDI